MMNANEQKSAPKTPPKHESKPTEVEIKGDHNSDQNKVNDTKSKHKAGSGHRSTKSRSRSRSHSDHGKRKKRSKHSRGRSRSRSESKGDHHSRRNRSTSRSGSRPHDRNVHSGGAVYRRFQAYHPMEARPSRCLGVFGMSIFTNETTLTNIFSRYGNIESIQIVYDRQINRSRGYAFVYFWHLKDAIRAKEDSVGLEIDGQKVRVDYSVTKGPHTSAPRPYMERFGNRNQFDQRYDTRPRPYMFKHPWK